MAVERHDVAEFVGTLTDLVNIIKQRQPKAVDAELAAVTELVYRRGSLTPNQIAAELGAPRSSVTRRVKKLLDAGTVLIRPDPADARSYQVQPTAAGQDEMNERVEKDLDRYADWLDGWTADEVRTFTALARRLAGEPQRPPEPPRKGAWWRRQLDS
jgi:DNA-binding MarR family transcriptional regulator